MKKVVLTCVCAGILAGSATAQFNLDRVVKGATKVVQSFTLTDEEVDGYAREFIATSDKENVICVNDTYTTRMDKLAKGINGVDGINIKIYKSENVNAFACSDGSVRVYSGLMDLMTDDEVLGVMGHEIGHFKNRDSRDAFKKALMNSAMRDGIASAGGKVATFTDSQWGEMGEAYLNSSYSQQQELDADQYGYNFLKSHGKNPWAMAMSFEKLKSLEANSSVGQTDAFQQLFSTHPALDVRIVTMTKKATDEGYKRPVAVVAKKPATVVKKK